MSGSVYNYAGPGAVVGIQAAGSVNNVVVRNGRAYTIGMDQWPGGPHDTGCPETPAACRCEREAR